MAIFVLIKRDLDWAKAIRENAWLIILIVYMAVSISWSNIPFISFKRWTKEFTAILMAFVVVSEPSPRQAMECIFRRTIYILMPFSLVLCKYFPEYGVRYGQWGQHMWIGVTTHKNPLGRLCLVAAFFLIWSLVRRKQGTNPPVWRYQTCVEGFVLLLSLYLMKGPGSYSATAVSSFAFGLLFYFALLILRRHHKTFLKGTVIGILAAIILLGVIVVFNKGSIVAGFAPTVGRNPTLTDRTAIWAPLLSVAMQRPLLGYGFGGFWTEQKLDYYMINEAHSGYLDTLLSIGFIGLLLFSAFLFSSARKALKLLSHDFDWGIIWICFILMTALHNITETSFPSLSIHLTAVVLFFSVFSVSYSTLELGEPAMNKPDARVLMKS